MANPSAVSIPKPIVIPASQNFEGNDGPWSSFTLRIGSPAQSVNVLVSTAGYQTWAVLPQGCLPSDGVDCSVMRGGLFDIQRTTTWIPITASPNATDTFTLASDANLGYSGNGRYGYDTVALGWEGSGAPSLEHQIVGGIATKEFYLGAFGLNPRPTNFTNFTDPVPSFLSTLKNRSMIPSLSWAYTAGNQYRSDKVLGSLTLGGYDASRFESNRLTLPFNQQDVRDLTVNIDAIFTTPENSTQRTELLSQRIPAYIDSTIPYIYLPLETCRNFENAFGIVWDENVQAYLVNDSLRTSLLSRNPNITFTLTNSTTSGSGSGSTLDIVLPYTAFDLIANPPLMKNTSRYFPLMRAANESQYTLGRTFLQEAYIIADYERRNFSVAPCSWADHLQQDIIAIQSPGSALTNKRHALGAGAITGISLGAAAGVAIAFALAFFSFARRKRRRLMDVSNHSTEGFHRTVACTGGCGPLEIDGEARLKPELHGTSFGGYEIGGGGLLIRTEVEGSHTWAQELDAEEVKVVELASVSDCEYSPVDAQICVDDLLKKWLRKQKYVSISGDRTSSKASPSPKSTPLIVLLLARTPPKNTARYP